MHARLFVWDIWVASVSWVCAVWRATAQTGCLIVCVAVCVLFLFFILYLLTASPQRARDSGFGRNPPRAYRIGHTVCV